MMLVILTRLKKYYDDDEPEIDASGNEIDLVQIILDSSANQAQVYNKVELIIKDVSRNPVKAIDVKLFLFF